MESILGGLLVSIVCGARADVDRRAKRHLVANIFAITGIVGFFVAVTQMV